MKLSKSLMGNTAHPRYDEFAEQVKQFEAKYGEDWDGTMIEYDNDFVSLPLYKTGRIKMSAVRLLGYLL